MMARETWRIVIGYPNYEVSSSGRFRRKSNRRIVSQHVTNGYLRVQLGLGCPSKLSHRLVARAFIGKPTSNRHEINHLNGIRHDNRPCNLEWTTRRRNALHRCHRLGGCIGERHGRARFTTRQVIAMRRLRKKGSTLISIGHRFDAGKAVVHAIVTRKTWRHI